MATDTRMLRVARRVLSIARPRDDQEAIKIPWPNAKIPTGDLQFLKEGIARDDSVRTELIDGAAFVVFPVAKVKEMAGLPSTKSSPGGGSVHPHTARDLPVDAATLELKDLARKIKENPHLLRYTFDHKGFKVDGRNDFEEQILQETSLLSKYGLISEITPELFRIEKDRLLQLADEGKR